MLKDCGVVRPTVGAVAFGELYQFCKGEPVSDGGSCMSVAAGEGGSGGGGKKGFVPRVARSCARS